MLKCVRYTDFSLEKFFNTIRKKDWFKNTLFVITSDHTANIDFHLSAPKSPLEEYHIPLLFYKPNSNLKGTFIKPVQQLDITPSIIDLLNLDISYFGFGNSFLDKKNKKYVYQYQNGMYRIADENHMVFFDGDQVNYYFDLSGTSNSPKLPQSGEQKKLLDPYVNHLKAVIQHFNFAMNNNALKD